MPYIKKTITHGNVIEVAKYTNGRYKRKKGNGPPAGETPPEQKAWQEKNDIRKVWRLLDENFGPGDLWTCLTYPARTKPSAETVREHMRKFIAKIRKAYKKAGKEFKYIYSAGLGKRGAAHIHLVLSKFDPEVIRDTWAGIVNGGDYVRCDFQPMHKNRDYYKLASYLIKNSKEDWEGPDPIFRKRYCSSKNLRKAKESTRIVSAKEWKKDPPQKRGYYIDKERSYIGLNAYGYPIQYTVYVKLGRQANEAETGGDADREILQKQEPDPLRQLQNKIL